MAIKLVLFFAILFGLPISFSRERFFKRLYLILVISSFVLLACFRDFSITPDVDNYESMYYRAKAVTLNSFLGFYKIDIGYYFVSWVASNANISFRLFASIIAIISFVSLYFLIDKQSKISFVSIVLFGCLTLSLTLMALRQTIAMSLIVFSYLFYTNKKKKIAIFLTLMSCLFHLSSIVFILYFLFSALKTKWSLIILTVFTSIIWLFRNQLFSLISQAMQTIGRTNYTYTNFYSIAPTTYTIFVLLVSALAAFSLVYASYTNKRFDFDKVKNEKDIMFFPFLTLAFLALGGGTMMRISSYYGLFLCVSITKSFYLLKPKNNVFYILLGAAFSSIILFYYWNNILTFRFYWEQ